MVFGRFYPTIWVNVVVIWFSSLLLYVILYFRLLKRLIDFFSKGRNFFRSMNRLNIDKKNRFPGEKRRYMA